MANNLQVENISIQDRGPQNTAADWVRLLRFSNDVNKSTVGVDTDRVTPLLLVAASKKLLGISRGTLKGDAKDSMRYQKVFGPVEYFALHIQRDGGSVARQMLWKATNKGNLDFISTNSLQPHISSVFNLSNLTRFIDNSTPLDGIDNSMLLTRLGLGGISSEDSAPILMRLVQPSYYGYVGPSRTQEKCYSADTLIMTKQGWKNIAEITLLDLLATLIDGRPAWNKPLQIQSYDHDGPMYGFQNWYTDFLVTPGHRMYVSEAQGKLEFSIKNILDIYGKDYKVLCACNKLSKVDLTQKWFYLPPALSTSKGGKKLLKNILKVDIVDFAAFLGWYIALGCCECRPNCPADKGMKYIVKISQDPKKSTENYNEIKALVLRLPFGATVKSAEEKVGRDIVVRRKQIYDYCKQFGKAEDKFIPDWIFTAPTRARWAFVDAMLKGDGAHQRDLCTISKRLAEDFARLLFLLGQSVNITKALQRWEYKRRVVDPANNFIYTVFWHRTGIQHIKSHRKSTKASGKTWYMLQYKGKVYCPTVPGGLVYIRRPYSTKGIWCGNSPGITAYMAKNVIRGTDGKLYQKMLNARTGKLLLVDSQKAASSIVTTNLILNTKDKYVYAMGGDSGVQIVPRSSVDYILPRADDAYSLAANAVPMLSGVKAMRLLMGCLHPLTPVPFVDENGFTDIVPAKRLGNYGDAYLSSCDKEGKETLVKLSKVVSRFSDFTRPFKRVVTSSGRVLITSPDHKWYIKKGLLFTKVTADKLLTGMIVPRSLFTKLPYKVTTILGVQITKLICVLIGRLLKSFEQTSKIYRFSYIKNLMFDQLADIERAFQQLNVVGCNHYVRDNIHYVSISDERLLDWIQTEIHLLLNTRKVPKSILSLPVGFTSLVIDSYCKLGDNVGLDMFGDAWLLDIPSVEMRDGLALMLGKLYSDTLYRDSYSNGRPQRALKAVPVKYSQNVVLLTIVKITDLPAPAFMVDIDCDDNVYAVGNGIITHNSKYALQAVPLQLPLAPLVRSLDLATGKDMDTLMGRLVGTQWAPKPGVVKAVRKDRIDMLYDDGTTGSIDLYLNFPANAKGWISNYPMVKAGDRVVKDQLLAKSNYSDNNGVCAMGRNLRVGYLSYHGGTYEDACVISLTAAKKMGYTTMYKTGMDLDKTIRNSKSLYNTWKPGLYSKLQMLNLDLHGVVKVGAKLSKGDPMILGIRSIEPSPGTMGKRLLTDVTLTWDHLHQGIVTDVVQTKNGIKVYAKVSAPLQVGDKISQRYGGKATVAQILPDLQMPRDAKDRPLLLLFDPLGIVSRCYDKLTKFLTKHGWKNGDQVQYDLLLYIYDPETDTCRWGRQLLPMHKSFYRGIMYGAKNKQVDFLVTPNHTMWTDKQSTAIQLYGLKCSLPTPLQSVLVDLGDWFTAPYHDYVYCPTVETGYVVTSRNSKVLCAGNTNPSQMILVALGKIALKTGKPVIVPQFMQPGQSRLKWAKEQLKKYNIPWKLNVYDPLTGKTVKDVFTGKMYFLPLKHIADTKMSARGTDLYTALGIPGGRGLTGCFPAMQNVWTIHGLRSIATICLKRIPLYVMSWDLQTKQWCWKQITDWFTYRAKTEDILNVFTENAISTYGGHANTRHTTSSYPTKNHKMYMADGSIKLAGLLKVGDYLAGVGTQYTEDQMQALYGTIMGDSCRSSKGGIQCMHSLKQYYYINYKRSIFAAVGASRVSLPKDVTLHTIKVFSGKLYVVKGTAVHMQIPKSYYTLKALLLTTDSAGKRHLTVPVLLAMGLFGFCLWFLDDGSMHNHTKHKGKAQPLARIATHSFSVELVQEAAKWLLKNLLHVENGTSITLYKGIHGLDQPCLNFRREASWLIARIIAKHIPWLVIPKSKMWLRSYCQLIQLKTPCVQHNFNSPLGIVPLKVKLIKPYKHDKPNVTLVNVYDFTVLGTHNYALSGGVRVSNSKRLGGLESAALVGHNAFNFLLDAKVIRGQANSQFWRSLRTGLIPVMPGLPLVHKKFFAHLQGAGMRIRKTTKGVSIMALTNQDVNLLAGSRLLKSKDTYLQKTFREIDGGLFGKDIFGTDGDRWGYIQLDEPLPNPVMLLPLAKLLRISDKQFQAVVAGKLLVNGMKNAADIKAALQKIDLKSLRSKALALLKQATPSKRDAALKRYVAIALMLANGSSPADYMLDRIPVLPPNFRPISTQGGLTMVADSNYLYAQLLDARDDAREAKALPQLYQDQARANIYRKWKLLVGLYDPLSKKLQAKDVKGLLRWALGKTPKFSAVQRKVIGSTVDTVGRGVVVPDSHLKLNEIGLPLSIAWNIYSPFVTRRLVMSGYTPVDAMKLVKGHSQAAKLLLLQLMQQRPVVMNRAPSLHKLSLMGFWPKMTTGYAIKVPPSIVTPFGMDFDGDSVLNTVLTWVDQDAFLDICQKHQKKDLTFQKSVLYYIQQQQKKGKLYMISNNTQIRLVHTVCSLADIPTVEGSEVQKSPTVTEWDVKGNIFVGTIDPVTGEKTVARMTKVSKHTGLKMYDCTLSISSAYSHVVTASEDHSLITLNPMTMELEKTKPMESKGRCVPRMLCDGVTEEPYVQRWITLDKPYPMSYELGMFFGLMIGDGWVDVQNYARIACCEESLQQYIFKLTKPKNTLPFTKQAHLSKYTPSENRFSQNTMDRFEVFMSEEDKKALASYIGKGAYNKRIPFMSFYGSKAHLLGIFCGLLATDGHIGISSTASKKATVKNIAYHTTSALLRDDIQLLCNKLGVKTRVTPYMGANSKATCYEIGFCLEDIARLKKAHPELFVVPVSYKEEALKAICKEVGKGVKNSFDIVPFPKALYCEFTYARASELHYHTVLSARAKGFIRRDHAKDIADVMEKIDWSEYQEPTYLKLSDRTNHTPEQAKALVDKWVSMVRNEEIGWEVVEDVTESSNTEGWDCTVPGPYTFTLSTGTVVQDTVNIHVPVSKAAVKDVILKMMPERNLISARKHQILYPPEKAFTQGIYVATRMGLPKPGGIQTFNSLQLAKEAYKKGLIDIDTPIDIKDKR